MADERHEFEALGDLVLGRDLHCTCGCTQCDHFYDVRGDGASRALYRVVVNNKCGRPEAHDIHYGSRALVGVGCAPHGQAMWIARADGAFFLE